MSSDGDQGYVVVLVIDLHFPEAGSLKAKRKDLQSIKSVLRGRFGAAVAETAHHDLWQRATLLAALTGRSPAHAEEAADHLERWLDGRCPTGVGVRRISASVADLDDVVSRARFGG
jgi:uncharacterized protein YlxP (DUF503 family)